MKRMTEWISALVILSILGGDAGGRMGATRAWAAEPTGTQASGTTDPCAGITDEFAQAECRGKNNGNLVGGATSNAATTTTSQTTDGTTTPPTTDPAANPQGAAAATVSTKTSSKESWFNKNKKWLIPVGALVLVGGLIFFLRRRNGSTCGQKDSAEDAAKIAKLPPEGKQAVKGGEDLGRATANANAAAERQRTALQQATDDKSETGATVPPVQSASPPASPAPGPGGPSAPGAPAAGDPTASGKATGIPELVNRPLKKELVEEQPSPNPKDWATDYYWSGPLTWAVQGETCTTV